MSDDKVEQAFWERADAFIRIANEQAATTETGDVGSSLLFAAARFNAFVVFTTAGSKAELAAAREEAVAHFSEQYLKMFEDNFDDHVTNFERYRTGG